MTFFCLSVLLKSCILPFLSILTFQSIYNGSPFSSLFTHSRRLLHLTLATQLTLNNETASVVLHNRRAVLTCVLTMPNTCLYRENKQRLTNNLWLSRGEGAGSGQMKDKRTKSEIGTDTFVKCILKWNVISSEWVIEWLLFNANWTTFQHYNVENKLHSIRR